VTSLAMPAAHAALTDVELMARARAGDSQAFGELVHRHHRVLYRSALSMVRSVADAEDVTQCAWIQAYRHVTAIRRQRERSNLARRDCTESSHRPSAHTIAPCLA